MSRGEIARRAVGTLLLVATIGLSSCQAAWHSAIGVFADAPRTSATRDA